jgi:hypothetical protein
VVHPLTPVRALSHRIAYTSWRARNRSVYRASLSCTGEDIATSPGGATAADSCSGAGVVSRPRKVQQVRQADVLPRATAPAHDAAEPDHPPLQHPPHPRQDRPTAPPIRESAGSSAGGSRGAPMVLGCCLPNRHGSRDSGTPASRQTSTPPTSRRSPPVHSPDQRIQKPSVPDGGLANQHAA